MVFTGQKINVFSRCNQREHETKIVKMFFLQSHLTVWPFKGQICVKANVVRCLDSLAENFNCRKILGNVILFL